MRSARNLSQHSRGPRESETAFFISRGQHRLSAVLHASDPRRIVVMAHGFSGNKIESGRLFVQCARSLTASGISALRFDFMGSGDSSGDFSKMTPNTEIADLLAVLDWTRRKQYRRVGLLGLSLGGAVSICAAAQCPAGSLAALCTWSTVPGFKTWRPRPSAADLDRENVWHVGPRFYSDRPVVDVPEAYVSLPIPKLQIQGDADLPSFQAEFSSYFVKALAPKRHVVIPGADHVFTHTSDRRRIMRETVEFFHQALALQRGS